MSRKPGQVQRAQAEHLSQREFAGFRDAEWGTPFNILKAQMPGYNVVQDEDFKTLVGLGRLGQTPSKIAYGFNETDRLCVGTYTVSLMKPEMADVVSGKREFDESLLYDFDLTIVAEQAVRGLISKYGAADKVVDELAFWEVSDRLWIVFFESSKYIFNIYYVEPSCAEDLLGVNLLNVLKGDDYMLSDL